MSTGAFPEGEADVGFAALNPTRRREGVAQSAHDARARRTATPINRAEA